MPTIHLRTVISAPVERCFDLCRSIDFHLTSTGDTEEEAVGGRTSGLIEMDETVTWRAKHFGVRQHLTSKITAFERPRHFRDEMLKGAFAVMKHDHVFEEASGQTVMIDTFYFRAPLGPLGLLAERMVLTKYMTRFLEERARVLKEAAESDGWKRFLSA